MIDLTINEIHEDKKNLFQKNGIYKQHANAIKYNF